jgi:acyl transferase domain-containing protein
LALAKALDSVGLKNKLWLGSAKANIGHSEAASGLVGVMKVKTFKKH